MVHGRLVEEDAPSIYFSHIKIYQGRGCILILLFSGSQEVGRAGRSVHLFHTYQDISRKRLLFDFKTTYQQKRKEVKKLRDES